MEEYKTLKFIKLVCLILLIFKGPGIFGSEDSDEGYLNESKSLLSGSKHLKHSSDEKVTSFVDEAKKLRLRQEALEQRKKTSIETESLTHEVLDRQRDQVYDEFVLEDKQRREALKIKQEENMLELKKAQALPKTGGPTNERLPLVNRGSSSGDFYTQIIKGFKSASWSTLTAVASCCCALPLIVWYYYGKKKV